MFTGRTPQVRELLHTEIRFGRKQAEPFRRDGAAIGSARIVKSKNR